MATATRSWWEGQPQVGFTQTAADVLHAPIVVQPDSMSDRIFIQRQRLLSALEGLRQGKQTFGIMHANVVSN